MNSFKSRISCDIDYLPSLKFTQQTIQPSNQTKKLISYLKSNPNPDINRKLRQQIFFKKITLNASDTTDIQKSSAQDKFQHCQKLKNNEVEKQCLFVNQPQNRKKAGFFSPKAQKQAKEKQETSPFIQNLKQVSKQSQKFCKNNFRLKRDVLSLNHDIFNSQKQINIEKSGKQFPQFLKKSPKTTNNIKFSQQQQQSKIKIQDFIILKNLGQGTFGQVFAGLHKYTSTIYTIKRYKKEIIKTHQLQQKFIHDIKTQLKFVHPQIVKLYGFFDDHLYFYMIFQYMESGNLAKTIQQVGGKLSQFDVCRKIYQINDALLFLHQKKLIHRDIKPASILTCLNVCKLCDTQWIQEDDDKSHNNTLCKQIDYTAPQALQGKQITPQFDIWGLGLIAFQLLTGKKFIVGSTQKLLIRKIITLKKQLIEVMLPKNCSQNIRNIILSALQPVASRRIKSSEINKMKLQKERQLTANSLINKNSVFSQKNIICQKSQRNISSGSPKNKIIFGVKKQIKNQVATLL